MKRSLQRLAVLIVLTSLPSCGVGGNPEPENLGGTWENAANHAYGNLNARLNGSLTLAFGALGNFGYLHEYFDKDSNPEKYEHVRGAIEHLAKEQSHAPEPAAGPDFSGKRSPPAR